MYKQTWNDRSNEVRWCMIYASYFQTLSVCFLRRHSILLPQYSCQVVIFWKSFSLFSWTRCTFRLLFLIHGFFLYSIFFLMLRVFQNLPQGGSCTLLICPCQFLRTCLFWGGTKTCPRPTLYFSCPRPGISYFS